MAYVLGMKLSSTPTADLRRTLANSDPESVHAKVIRRELENRGEPVRDPLPPSCRGGDPLLDSRRMAARLRVPLKWLRDEARAGRITCLPTGSDFLFHPETVERELVERASRRTPAEVSHGK